MKKEQTAVEFLQQTYFKTGMLYRTDFQIAKGMEEDQILWAHFSASGCNSFDIEEEKINTAYNAAKQYYDEKFGVKVGGKDE